MPNAALPRHRRRAVRSARTVTAVGARAGSCRRYVIYITLDACDAEASAPDPDNSRERQLPRSPDEALALADWMIRRSR